jgi:hypothetical protein
VTEFRITDTFTDSLEADGDEQKVVMTTSFDLTAQSGRFWRELP